MRPVLIDSNVLIDVFSDDANWFTWSRDQLTSLCRTTRLHINPVVFAEISIAFARIEELESHLASLPIVFSEIPKEALFLAGRAFIKYRRIGGNRLSPLPDFFIGAHAAVNRWRLLTRDASRMRFYYPSLEIIAP